MERGGGGPGHGDFASARSAPEGSLLNRIEVGFDIQLS
jgi:hypothetical protein